MRVAPAVVLSESDKEWMLKQSRSAIAPKRLGERCQIVLLAAEGKTNEVIAAELSMTRQKAGRWRTRFVLKGRIGIEKDEPGRGRKFTYPVELRDQLVRKTTRAKPTDATQWSRTSMAKAMSVSPSTVGRIWKQHGLKPHLERTFKLSNDPRFTEKLEDIVGLYSMRQSTRWCFVAMNRAERDSLPQAARRAAPEGAGKRAKCRHSIGHSPGSRSRKAGPAP